MSNPWLAVGTACVLTACGTPNSRPGATFDRIDQEMAKAVASPARTATVLPDAVGQAMLPPLELDSPSVPPPEPRFNLAVNSAPASQVFMALVSGTKYSMVFAPDLTGTLTLNLKNVTLREALDTIRELYGYEYKIQGNRIMIQSNTMQSRIFQINYLASRRQGTSDLSITSSGVPMQGAGAYGTTPMAGNAQPVGMIPGSSYSSTASTQVGVPASRVRTTSEVDFWKDLETALNAIVGSASSAVGAGTAGPGIIINTVSGIVVVRAMPREMRLVENYLKATQAVVERQVMLEAKILEVRLSEGYQSGVNWSVFNSGANSNLALGVAAPGSTVRPLTRGVAAGTSVATNSTVNNRVVRDQNGNLVAYDPTNSANTSNTNSLVTTTTTTTAATAAAAQAITANNLSVLPGLAGNLTAATSLGNGFVGLAFQTSNFGSLLSFLETQGNVQVLSSPRIATLNNQKAVLKVGNDGVYITGFTVSSSSTIGATTTTTTAVPTPTTSTLFSGISLDVMPQIDDEGNIVLHVHPAVSTVSETQKRFDLGTAGLIQLPLASRDVNETDSIVRVRDGNIVAIGGLMSQDQSIDRSGLPGTTGSSLGALVGQRSATANKRELVILLKPTVIASESTWVKDLEETNERMRRFDPRMLGADKP